MPPTKTLRELFDEGRALLAGTRDPLLESKVLLLRAARVGEERFLARPDDPVEPRREAFFRKLLEGRRRGVPIAHLTGVKEFWSLPFRVGPSVLIPRPETEMLVERVLALTPTGRESILDVGTGCGCIAVALARERPRARVVASDVSARALAVARANAARHGAAGIEFVRGSLLAPFRRRGDRFDVVVSNPPYIPRPEYEALEDEVRRHEPRRALLGGEDGLDLIRRLARQAPRVLSPGGYLVLEIGDGQRRGALDAFGAGWREIETGWDLAGVPRVITARRHLLKFRSI